jgi:DNA-binding NarL/FixJ family response regulator
MLVTDECIQVLLCGAPVVREGIKTVLQKQKRPAITIVAETDDPKELQPLIKKHKPRMAIAELPASETNLLKQQLNRSSVPMPLVVLTESNRHTALTLLNMGVKGIVHRTSTPAEIVDAVMTVLSGEHYYCPHTAKQLLNALMKERNESAEKINFSNTEKKIIELICLQKTTKEIGEAVGVSTRTIDEHRRKIQKKTGTKNGVGIALYAVRNGLFQL